MIGVSNSGQRLLNLTVVVQFTVAGASKALQGYLRRNVLNDGARTVAVTICLTVACPAARLSR